MTCLVGEKWEVTPYHAWSALAWGVGIAVLVAAVVTGEERLAWVALFLSAMIATYNICASRRATHMEQMHAFELGKAQGRREAVESGVPRLH